MVVERGYKCPARQVISSKHNVSYFQLSSYLYVLLTLTIFKQCLMCLKLSVTHCAQSIFNMIPVEDQKSLPEDEDTPEKRSEKIWDFFGKKDNGMEVHCPERQRLLGYKYIHNICHIHIFFNSTFFGMNAYTHAHAPNACQWHSKSK